MKRLIFTLIASVMMIAAFAKDKAEITFKTTEHDFGYIKEDGGSVSCEFEFTNTGNKPLIIIEAVASCGRTSPEYPKRPIAPGKSGVITVYYNPIGRPGGFKKDVKVRTNAGSGRTKTLTIIGSAIPAKEEK